MPDTEDDAPRVDPFGARGGPQDETIGHVSYSVGPQLFDPGLYVDGSGHSTAAGIRAHAGGGQALATQLGASINRVTAALAAGDSVALPHARGGQIVIVENAAGKPIQLFANPTTTDTINGVAGATGVPLPSMTAVMLSSSVAGIWSSIPSGAQTGGGTAGVASWNARVGDVTLTAADVTTALAYTPASRKGITDGSNAAAGDIGEFISASVQVGSPLSAITQVPIDITTMVLSAGDFDLLGQVGTVAASGGHIQHMQVWMNSVSKTPPTVFAGAFHEVGGISTGGTEQMVLPTGRLRMNITAPTTVYLSTKIQFTGTLSCYGFMSARRVR